MFQFTTTNVINTDKQDGKAMWAYDADSKTFSVKRRATFKESDVQAIYIAAAKDAVKETAQIDLSDLTAGKNYRLNMYIGLTQGSNDAMYSNDMYYKGKPVVVDFIAADTSTATAKNLVKMIKTLELNVQDSKMFEVSVASGSSIVKIEAVTPYQRFKKLDIEELDLSANNGLGSAKVVESGTVTAKGDEGCGTYEQILHNVRIPTNARNAFLAPNSDEEPVPGHKYTQITIHMCTNRGPLGTNAVGDLVKSHTTHVFYVLDTYATDFVTKITAFGGDKVKEVPEPAKKPGESSGGTKENG